MKNVANAMITRLVKHTNAEEVGTVRNTFLAAAALSTAILVALTQVGVKATALKIAVIGCSLAAPIWVCLAGILEVYLHIGESSFPHLRQFRVDKTFTILQAVAGVALFVALCCVIYFLLPFAASVFVVSSLMSLVYVGVIYTRLASWLSNVEDQSK